MSMDDGVHCEWDEVVQWRADFDAEFAAFRSAMTDYAKNAALLKSWGHEANIGLSAEDCVWLFELKVRADEDIAKCG